MNQKGIFSTITNNFVPNPSQKTINVGGAFKIQEINHYAPNPQGAECIYNLDQDEQQPISSYDQVDFDSQFKHILNNKHNYQFSQNYVAPPQQLPNLQITESSQFSQIRDQLNEMEFDNNQINYLPPQDALIENSRLPSLRQSNLTIQCEKKSYHNQQFLQNQSISSQSNSDTTLFKQDIEKTKDNSVNLPHQNSLTKSLSSYQETSLNNSQLNTNQTGLVTQSQLDKFNINSIEEDTSSLSAIPIIKKKKSIQKNNNPLQTNPHSSQQKGCMKGHKKRALFINTSALSLSQKKDSCNQAQNNLQNNTSLNQNILSKDNMKIESNLNEIGKNKAAYKNIDNNSQVRISNYSGDKNKQKQSNTQENMSKKVRFTQQEDEELINLITIHGKKWRVISQLMNGKNETRIRNRYYSYIRNLLQPDENQQNQNDSKDSAEIENCQQLDSRIEEIQNLNQNKFQTSQQNQINNNTNRFDNEIQNRSKSNKKEQNQQNQSVQFKNKRDQNKDALTYQSDIKNNNYYQNKINHEFTNQNQQQSTTKPSQLLNSIQTDSLKILTLNNFEKDFNGICYELNNLQSNCQNSLLEQSNNQFQYQLSTNNLNYVNNNIVRQEKLSSYKYLNSLKGSVQSLDLKIENQYLNNKNTDQRYEAMDAEEYYQNFNQDEDMCFSSDMAQQNDQQIISRQQQNSFKQIQSQQYQDVLQTFCPNKILKSKSDLADEIPSPLIFAKAQKKYDPKRFLNIDLKQITNAQNPTSRYSMDEEMTDDNANEQSKTYNEYDDACYRSMSEVEKIQKIAFLNSQVDNISTMIESCKQEILKEITKKKKSI